ncbi:exonuclease [Flavobacterium suaedae]|uniref:Exonuclease n=1 Tax=Flavobacterium suaedae TaxID=1767027 RepID=A0ABQ1JH60_9FLAO|nr:exonuclease domain-containing protein [Flavobacterium suaedae]GGB68325.1 exonuclease [Flavobacterium suaedae]
MYAILDIETTGGQYNEEGITEIAIYQYDGHEITDQFISLINPEKPIQPFVVKLTGINNEMLRNAPKFYDVAKRIIEITEGCIIVAHNAGFDYRVLQAEFDRLGYNYQRQSLCTVELSQKLLPEQKSHSLGKLVRSLGIPISDRHRASGDAMATVKLFKLLLAKDVEKEIIKNLVRSGEKKEVSAKIFNLLEDIPPVTGMYYIYKENGNLVYIGKSNNIKRRLHQHFTGTSRKAKRLQKDAFTINYEETGNELIAQLKENQEVAANKPIHNRLIQKVAPPYSLYSKKNKEGYIVLTVAKTDYRKKEVTSFRNTNEARNAINKFIEEYNLSSELIATTRDIELDNIINGTDITNITAEEYNTRVDRFIKQYSFYHQNMIIIDKGRSIEERSAVLIEKGVYKGYAFYDLNHQINKPEILKNILIPMPHNRDIKNIIQSYLRKKRNLKIIRF